MSRLVDEDGIDGPFERAMRRSEAQDRRNALAQEQRNAIMIFNHGDKGRRAIAQGVTHCDCSLCRQRPPRGRR